MTCADSNVVPGPVGDVIDALELQQAVYFGQPSLDAGVSKCSAKSTRALGCSSLTSQSMTCWPETVVISRLVCVGSAVRACTMTRNVATEAGPGFRSPGSGVVANVAGRLRGLRNGAPSLAVVGS